MEKNRVGKISRLEVRACSVFSLYWCFCSCFHQALPEVGNTSLSSPPGVVSDFWFCLEKCCSFLHSQHSCCIIPWIINTPMMLLTETSGIWSVLDFYFFIQMSFWCNETIYFLSLYYQLDFVTHFQISVIKNVLWSYLPMQTCSSSHLLSTSLPACAQYIYNMHRSELFSVMPLHFMWILGTTDSTDYRVNYSHTYIKYRYAAN